MDSLVPRINSTAVDELQVVHPVAIGTCYALDRSFTAIDQESGEAYVGAQVRSSSGADPEWRVWRDKGYGFEDITVEVSACIGRPLEQLAAIYWRA